MQVYYEFAHSYNCIFLSTKYFQDPFCWSHLILTMSKKNKACFSAFPKEAVDTIWMECFKSFPRPLHLFVYLSSITISTLTLMLGTAIDLYNDYDSQMLLSLSSSTRHIMHSTNIRSQQTLSSLISYCQQIHVLGFTEHKAKHYVEVFESSLKFHEVYLLTYTNPLLLRTCLTIKTVHDLESQLLETVISSFLLHNFCIDTSNINTEIICLKRSSVSVLTLLTLHASVVN